MADLNPYPFEHHYLCQPLIEEADGLYRYHEKIYAECINFTDEAICRAVIKAARDAGITQLYLLDRDFVVNALTTALENRRANDG